MDVMWDNVGVMRDANSIERGLSEIADLKSEMTDQAASNNVLLLARLANCRV